MVPQVQQVQQQVAVEIVPDRPLVSVQPLASLRAQASFQRSRLPAQGDADERGSCKCTRVNNIVHTGHQAELTMDLQTLWWHAECRHTTHCLVLLAGSAGCKLKQNCAAFYQSI